MWTLSYRSIKMPNSVNQAVYQFAHDIENPESAASVSKKSVRQFVESLSLSASGSLLTYEWTEHNRFQQSELVAWSSEGRAMQALASEIFMLGIAYGDSSDIEVARISYARFCLFRFLNALREAEGWDRVMIKDRILSTDWSNADEIARFPQLFYLGEGANCSEPADYCIWLAYDTNLSPVHRANVMAALAFSWLDAAAASSKSSYLGVEVLRAISQAATIHGLILRKPPILTDEVI